MHRALIHLRGDADNNTLAAMSIDALKRTVIGAIGVDGPREQIKFEGPTKDLLAIEGLAEEGANLIQLALVSQFEARPELVESILSTLRQADSGRRV